MPECGFTLRKWLAAAISTTAFAATGTAQERPDVVLRYDGLTTRTKLDMLTARFGLPRRLHGFLNELKQQYTMDIVYQQGQAAITKIPSRGTYV